MQRIKHVIRNLLYNSGLLSLYHLIRNRHALTVVIFHRVLAANDSRWQSADPEWTVTPEFFADALRFFKRHYNVISLKSLDNHCLRNGTLPPRPLLITFDDGWADNYEYALPVLLSHQVTATVFVVSDSVGQRHSFWQDTLWGLWRRKQLTAAIATDLWNKCGLPAERCPVDWDNEASIRGFIAELNCSPGALDRIQEAIFDLESHSADKPLMLSSEEVQGLCEAGIAIGSHGQTHAPLTRVPNPASELLVSRDALSTLLASRHNGKVNAMSFPHGQANDTLVQMAHHNGYDHLFTGGNGINYLDRHHRVYARFDIHQGRLSNPDGALAPAKVAMYMFRQQYRRP